MPIDSSRGSNKSCRLLEKEKKHGKNYFVVWSHPSALCPARKLLTPWFGMEARSPPGVARALHLQGSLQYIISTQNINTTGDLFLASVQEIPPCVKNL